MPSSWSASSRTRRRAETGSKPPLPMDGRNWEKVPLPGARYETKVPCGVRDESFLTHILLFGMLVQRLVCRPPDCRLRSEVGSSKGRCRRPTCLRCAGYNRAHTASAGYPYFLYSEKRAASAALFYLKKMLAHLFERGPGRVRPARYFFEVHALEKVIEHFLRLRRKLLRRAFHRRKAPASFEAGAWKRQRISRWPR